MAAYKKMIATVAEETAKASKEGGFLGFGGERVSAGEQAFLGPGEVAPAGLSFVRVTALAGKSFERLHHIKNKEGGERVWT